MKRVFAIFLVAVLVLSLCACVQKPEPTTTPTTETTEATETTPQVCGDYLLNIVGHLTGNDLLIGVNITGCFRYHQIHGGIGEL